MKTREAFVSFSNINCDRPFFQPNIYKIEKKKSDVLWWSVFNRGLISFSLVLQVKKNDSV